MRKESLCTLARKLMREYVPVAAGTSGKVSVTTEVVSGSLPVVTLREAYHSGLPQCQVRTDRYELQKLIEEEQGTWMSNLPCELVQMEREMARYAQGHVLIGGLGLGILARRCLANPRVKTVTVVENNPDVIRLVASFLHRDDPQRRFSCYQADLFDYVKSSAKTGELPFDTALLDIWQGTGEWTWQSEVVPLRRLIGPRIPLVLAWQEQTMKAQVQAGLFRAVDIPEEKIRRKAQSHWYAFRCAAVDLGLCGQPRLADPQDFQKIWEIKAVNSNDRRLKILARTFLDKVGTPIWEKTFGRYWDAAWEAE